LFFLLFSFSVITTLAAATAEVVEDEEEEHSFPFLLFSFVGL
jgi:hypothetical protein